MPVEPDEAPAGTEDQRASGRNICALEGFVWEADPETLQLVSISVPAEGLLGYTVDQWLQPCFLPVRLHPNDRDDVLQLCREAARGSRHLEFEYRMIAADGEAVPLRSTIALFNNGPTPVLRATTVERAAAKDDERSSESALWFFESMDRINRALHQTTDLERTMSHALDAVLAIFACDRAWLAYPCDPRAGSWRVPMERTKPEFPGAFSLGIDIPMGAEAVRVFELLRASSRPVQFGQGSEHRMPESAAKDFGIQSQMAVAVYPRNDSPYAFGIHQCSHARVWTSDEERLFESVGRRLGDALTSLLAHRALQESQAKLSQAQQVAHLGHWDTDFALDRIVWSDETYRIAGLEPQERELTLAEVLRMTHPDDRSILNRAAQRALQAGERFEAEYRIVRPSGEIRFVHSQGEVTKDESRLPIHAFGVVQDITERRQAEEKLRASEARLRTFIDHATDAFFLHEIEGVILDLNRQACEALGYTREELIGQPLQDLDVLNDPGFLKQIEVRLASGEKVSFDSIHRRKDGTVFPVEVRISPYRERGRTYAVSSARDVSGQKRAEAALTLFRSLIDRTNDAIEVVDPATGQILDVNERACLRHGYTREEYLSLTVAEIDPLAASRGWKVLVEELRRVGSKVFEGTHRCKDGTFFPVEINSNFIQLDRDYIVSVVRDIADRKRADEAVRQAEHKYRSIFDNAIEGIFQTTLDGRFLTANPALARMLGYESPAELISSVQDVAGQLHVDPERRNEYLATLRERKFVQGFECELFRKDGSKAWVSLSTRVVSDSQGNPPYLEGTVEEITRRKRLEEQFRQSQKMEAIGRLAGGVAHDFNNLLTVITGYSELALARLPTDDPNRPLLAEIQKSGLRAAALTRQLLAFSRKQVLQPHVVSLNSLVRELHKLLQRLIGEDIELILDPAASRDRAKLDPGQFEQAIVNMAVNARDAMPEGGRLTIVTRDAYLGSEFAERHQDFQPGRYVEVRVSDTGQGMGKETAARVFEPFFTTKALGKGTGLGLAMVYGFVKQSGGQIEVRSQPGQGTTFEIYLPAVEAEVSVSNPEPEPERDECNETVLLVEDEDSVRDLLTTVLRTMGYTVLEAADGTEATRIAKRYQGPIQILVTDVMMPGMSGRQVAETVIQSRPSTRILFISGYTDEAVLRHGALEANVGFLQKPFSADDLARKVREVLSSGGGSD